MTERIGDIRVDSSGKQTAHQREAKALRSNMGKFKRLFKAGDISATEYNDWLSSRKDLLATLLSQSDSIQTAEDATREQAEGIIELLPLIKDFVKLRQDLTSQVEIAKIILSNRLLKDGTMQYRYINPFDVYIKFGLCPVKRVQPYRLRTIGCGERYCI